MAYIVRPPEGQTPSDGWKNTPYTFYNPTPSTDAVTGDPITVAVPAGTYTWSGLKEEKKRLQDAIDEINLKMAAIEAENVVI